VTNFVTFAASSGLWEHEPPGRAVISKSVLLCQSHVV
jgi:hypothetical protein